MTFSEALLAHKGFDETMDVIVSRPRGPQFRIDHLGQMTMENDCLYVGDIIDLTDWEVKAEVWNEF